MSCEQFQLWKRENDPEYQRQGLAGYLRDNGISKACQRLDLKPQPQVSFPCLAPLFVHQSASLTTHSLNVCFHLCQLFLFSLLSHLPAACPHCRFQYALTKGGCMHFSCSQCRYQFCSGCNNPYHKVRVNYRMNVCMVDNPLFLCHISGM